MVQQIHVLKGFLEENPAESLLSPNQQLALALFDKTEEISTKLVSDHLAIPVVSAKQVLSRLFELKLIVRLGAGRTTRCKNPERKRCVRIEPMLKSPGYGFTNATVQHPPEVFPYAVSSSHSEF